MPPLPCHHLAPLPYTATHRCHRSLATTPRLCPTLPLTWRCRTINSYHRVCAAYELKHAYPEGVVFEISDDCTKAFGTPQAYEWGAGRKLDSRGDSRVTQAPSAAAQLGPSGQGGGSGVAIGGGRACLGGASLGGARMWHNPTVDGAAIGGSTNGGASGTLLPSGATGMGGPGGGSGALLCGGAADGGSRVAATDTKAQAPTTTGRVAHDMCRIQVKGTRGQMACVLELPSSATLAAVHTALLEQSIVAAGSRYELHTLFPAQKLGDPNRTLGALGLAPSATLCVRMAAGGGA